MKNIHSRSSNSDKEKKLMTIEIVNEKQHIQRGRQNYGYSQVQI